MMQLWALSSTQICCTCFKHCLTGSSCACYSEPHPGVCLDLALLPLSLLCQLGLLHHCGCELHLDLLLCKLGELRMDLLEPCTDQVGSQLPYCLAQFLQDLKVKELCWTVRHSSACPHRGPQAQQLCLLQAKLVLHYECQKVVISFLQLLGPFQDGPL